MKNKLQELSLQDFKDKRYTGGAEGSRTPDLDDANVALYQLSYDPNVNKVKRENVSQ